jgi:hypothetical protein
LDGCLAPLREWTVQSEAAAHRCMVLLDVCFRNEKYLLILHEGGRIVLRFPTKVESALKWLSCHRWRARADLFPADAGFMLGLTHDQGDGDLIDYENPDPEDIIDLDQEDDLDDEDDDEP